GAQQPSHLARCVVADSAGALPEGAEQEQDYYLQQLFGLYGENGALSFEGLTRLLASLGLGKVQVVELEHEALGHAPTPRTASRDAFLPVATDGPSASGGPGHHGSRMDPLQHPPAQPGLTLLERVLALDHSVSDHLHEDCLNVTQLLVNFGLDSVSKITPEQFTLLCPALLYQIDSRVCIQHHDPGMPEPLVGALWPGNTLLHPSIGLPSALAILLLPFLGHDLGRLLLAFLVALAVGTLCGDALLHLWPHAQEKHQEPEQQQDSVLKGLMGLVGIYLLFLMESLLRMLKQRRTAESQRLTAPERTDGWGEQVARVDSQAEQLGHHGHSHSLAAGPGASISDLAWMVILGDGIHNLTDGLAIGAAFSDGLSSGLSTTVAVFCHELPHELGDFAVLLQAGVPIRRVLLANVMSAFLAYLGMAVGMVLSQHASPIAPWIFASTAGIFLYVALVDMVRGGPATYLEPLLQAGGLSSTEVTGGSGCGAAPPPNCHPFAPQPPGARTGPGTLG
uniref:Solute carrier family 39 member 5 n=1 Tax=Pelusios castaneus TaxID=367368 RepID=A0A8C8SNE3_9SAUR